MSDDYKNHLTFDVVRLIGAKLTPSKTFKNLPTPD